MTEQNQPVRHSIRQIIRIGLDVGGTNIKAAILSESDEILFKLETPSFAGDGPQAVRKSVISAITTSIEKSKITPQKIGIGCAGSVNTHTGIVINSPNFSDWSEVPLAKWVKEDTGLETSVHNDANCAAVAEWKTGAGKGYDNVVLLTFGTGIGGGLVIDNNLYTGSTGTAGELGHLSIKYDGIPCPCGNTGCFERYCSASALQKTFPNESAKDVFQKATHNETYRTAIDQFMTAMTIGLTSIANTFDPDCIILGGGLSKGFSPYLERITCQVKTHAFPAVGKHIKIKLSTLGSWSGAVGAGLLST